MIQIVPLKPEHILGLKVQQVQSAMVNYITPKFAQEMCSEVAGPKCACIDGDEVLGVAGIVQMHDTRGYAWSILGTGFRRGFKTIHRAILEQLDTCGFQRVEMAVDCEHLEGIRWAQRLGFELEGRMKKYTADGRDCYLFGRV